MAGSTDTLPLATEKYQKSMCGAPIRDKTSVVPAVNWSLYPIALLSVVFRFWARSSWGKGAGLWWDDYSILLCIVLFTAGSSVTTRSRSCFQLSKSTAIAE